MSRSTQNKLNGKLLDTLAELGGNVIGQDDIIFEGRKFIIPENLDLMGALKFLKDKAKESEEETTWSRVYPAHPLDLAQAVDRIAREYFGTVVYKAPGLFDNVSLTAIEVGPGETVSVPFMTWFELPVMPGVLLAVHPNPEDFTQGILYAQGLVKHRNVVEGFFRLIEEQLPENSVYKGKPWRDIQKPHFYDLSTFDSSQFKYSEDALKQLNVSLWSPIRHTLTTKNFGLPLKRAVLLHGPFGTGKSGAGLITAKVAEANGWTFISVRPGLDDFNSVIRLASRYGPAVVFVEDIDTMASSEEEAERISEMLDVLDGLEAKTERNAIMLVMTTNHPDALHRGVLRPGRIDALVEIGLPDATAIRGIVEWTLGYQANDFSDTDWARIADAMDGFLPAFVSEASQRAIRYAIVRAAEENGLSIFDNVEEALDEEFLAAYVGVSGTDVVDSANGLRPQLVRMLEAKTAPTAQGLDAAFASAIRKAVHGETDEIVTEVGGAAAEAIHRVGQVVVKKAHEKAYEGAYEGSNDAHA